MKYFERKSVSKQLLLMFSVFVILNTTFSCKNKNQDESQEGNKSLPEEKNIVETVVIQNQDFTREIVSNGKLSALQSAELWFKASGIVKEILVKNGETVQKGETLASLYDEDMKFSYDKAEIALEQAELERRSILISMEYNDGVNGVPPDRLKIANIRSGYSQSSINLEEAGQTLKNAIIIAPFTGKIEGIEQKPFEKADPSKPFCTLINDKHFTIDFPLLETEFNQVKIGQQVEVSPIATDKKTRGTITEINPSIDENGLVWVKAEVDNPGGYIEGMNVKVSIKHSIHGQLVVPKQAVVLRQNREVLFRYTKGIAYWTYINVLDENETQYSVVAAEGATLNPGDTVIISNNLNLAHESEVELKK